MYATAQTYASMNSAFLRSRHISVAVMGISVDPATMVVSVSVSADPPSLIPGVLAVQGQHSITGTAEARLDGR